MEEFEKVDLTGKHIPKNIDEWTSGLDKHFLKEKFLKYYRDFGGSGSKASKATKISRSTWIDWKNTDPEFKQALEDIDDSLVDLAQEELIKFIKARKNREGLNKIRLDAIKYFLDKKGKNRGYGSIETATDNQININIIGLDEKGEGDVNPKSE